MQLHIDKRSDLPIYQQLADQIVFLIVTEALRPGSALPSVRELARRLKIHHNTVSQAYQDLVLRKWLLRRHGSRLVVPPNSQSTSLSDARDLDDLINRTIRFARERGHSLQALRAR